MNLRIIYITIMLLGLSVSPACADYIQGHIVRIDREQGVVDLVLCDMPGNQKDCLRRADHDVVHGEDGVQVKVVAVWLPRCLAEGMMVFARGAFAKEDAGVFEADEVFPRRRMGSEDKTGVRSRFRHQTGRGYHKGQHGE